MKNQICINHSVFSLIAFLQNAFFINQFIVIKRNLQPSSAGIGSRLNTHKLIDIIAHITNKNTNPACIELVIKSTIQIGHLTCSKASCLSTGVSGLNIFLTIIHNHLNVRRA
ncbi:hypothetical protein HOF65_06370 [bacterium]|jgi:hypothetical protein|nr:hypothetical protein [bacterium]MBT3853553.1 hypothetical protein [bacterium]MBT4632542.1 hypothetical protein [bacterium]MBT5491725.1 hypothetical protein [bacterium]MBT6779044.1 hypothetical protein [bacterium]